MARPPHDARDPQDQRLIIFALLSLAILMFWNANSRPPVQDPDKAAQEAAEKSEEPDSDGGAANAVANADDPDEGDSGDDPTQADEEAEIEAALPADPATLALGSAAADSPYRMLLTVTNKGAAITRLGLSSSEFSDIDRLYGSLGVLDLSNAADTGAELGVVGAGTPAAEAGLSEGDVILGGQPVDKSSKLKPAEFANSAALHKWLTRSKPGESVALSIAANEATGQAARTATVKLTRPALQVLRPESENVLLHQKQLPKDFADTPSLLVRLSHVGDLDAASDTLKAANKRLTEENWTVVESDGDSATLAMDLPDVGLRVTKTFSLVKVPAESQTEKDYPGYHFDFQIGVENLRNKSQTISYELEGPNGLPIEGFWYANKIGRKANGGGAWSGVGLRDVIVRTPRVVSQMNPTYILKDKYEEFGQGVPLAYIGIDAQYFATMLIPQKETVDEVWFDYGDTKLATQALDEKVRPTLNNPTFTITRQPVTLAAEGSDSKSAHSDSFTVFAGPKRPELLAQYHPPDTPVYSLNDILYYGWFGPVAQVMLSVLHAFYSVVRNYGIAILLLTVVVRLCMYPLSRKQAMNMVKMQELKPEIDRIAEKYKNDMEKRSKAQQDLFRKHNYNPMGGCLLMFIQLPIFLGLYRALAVDVELREAPLISEFVRFCSNLAAPDMAIDWSGLMPHSVNTGVGFFGLGPYLNVLPIVTIILFLAQQKMFMPEPTNEQAAMQQKMMKYMMIFMGFMFFKVPSGLCIYFIASSLWGITERKLLPHPKAGEGPNDGPRLQNPKYPPKNPPKDQKPTPGGGKPSTNGASAKTRKNTKKKSKRR